MSALVIEGAEDGLAIGRADFVSGMSIASSNIRTGSHALLAGVGSVRNWAYGFSGTEEDDGMIVGFGFFVSNTNINAGICRFLGDGGAVVHITITNDTVGRIQAKLGTSSGTLLAETSPGALIASSYDYWEIKVKIADASGRVIVRRNHATVIDFTGDTKNAGVDALIDEIDFGSAGGTTTHYDDLYIFNEQGADWNDFFGDCRIYGATANGNGNYSQLVGSDGNSTDNYLQVDEDPINTSDYNGSATVTNKDTYLMGDLPVSTGTCGPVQVGFYAAKTDAGAKQFRGVHRRAATDSFGPDTALSTTYEEYSWMLERDPSDAALWTVTKFNDSEIGFEVRT